MKRRLFMGMAASAAALPLVASAKATHAEQGDALPGTEAENTTSTELNPADGMPMDLGAFSVSLTVKDLEASKKFYETLGFKAFAGDASKKWLMLKNRQHVIGLFQGMFEKNILTFNPGWDQNAKKQEAFQDIRDIQRQLKAAGVKLLTEADEKTKGPASLMIVDPDGNQILIDQHV
jgi:predicted enzyme related to lactoylglutathione lyase